MVIVERDVFVVDAAIFLGGGVGEGRNRAVGCVSVIGASTVRASNMRA